LIVSELINSLDMNYPISEELLELYDFALRGLAEANMHKTTEPLDPIIEMVDSIREAWKEISNMNRGQIQLIGEERA